MCVQYNLKVRLTVSFKMNSLNRRWCKTNTCSLGDCSRQGSFGRFWNKKKKIRFHREKKLYSCENTFWIFFKTCSKWNGKKSKWGKDDLRYIRILIVGYVRMGTKERKSNLVPSGGRRFPQAPAAFPRRHWGFPRAGRWSAAHPRSFSAAPPVGQAVD